MSMTALAAISSGMEQKAPLRSYWLPASGLRRFASSLRTLFDESTQDIVGAKANPAVWNDRPAFNEQIAQYEEATTRLLAATEGNDPAAVAAALASTKAACKACHDTYRTQ